MIGKIKARKSDIRFDSSIRLGIWILREIELNHFIRPQRRKPDKELFDLIRLELMIDEKEVDTLRRFKFHILIKLPHDRNSWNLTKQCCM